MRIGFDAKRMFRNTTGLANYGRVLVRSLRKYYPGNEYILFTPKAGSNEYDHFKTVTPESNKLLWRSFGIVNDVRKENIELFHGLSNEMPFGMHRYVKTVVTIHDVIFKRFPNHYKLFDRTVYDLKTAYACKHAHAIVAISEATKNDLIHFYGAEEKRIHVVLQPANPVFSDPVNFTANEIEGGYFLYVGSITERKNLLTICEAMNILKPGDRIPVVVVGRGGAYFEKVKNYIYKHRLEKWFIYKEGVGIEKLVSYYHHATAFLYPSLYEGFGIPVLEAMAAGCPVITANTSSMPEVGGDAALYIDPLNAEQLAGNMLKIKYDNDLRTELMAKGRVRAGFFDERKCAQEMMSVYQSLL